MRRTAPLILGAGPAGCAAAIALARDGLHPILLDRDGEARDQLCGGFLSWRTADQLRVLGVDPVKLGAQSIERVAIFAGRREIVTPLPSRAYGLSRRVLDSALRERALAAGAEIAVDTARGLEGTEVIGRTRRWSGDGLFLATGKHDLRGLGRPRLSRDPALGLRLRLPPSQARIELLANRIELHLFAGGYAGVVLHEDGTANVCLAVRKTLLAQCGGQPAELLVCLAKAHPAFAQRLAGADVSSEVESIGAVPYGWIARTTESGLFRLGDQAAVIPSLAGEGISIAIASGALAARVWLEHGAAGAAPFQRQMAKESASPLRAAALARTLAESPFGARLGVALAARIPAALRRLIEASRISPDAPLAPSPTAP
jgi:flavin-dependent dehydrogenase